VTTSPRLALLLVGTVIGCGGAARLRLGDADPAPAVVVRDAVTTAAVKSDTFTPRERPVVLVAGGDIDMGRVRGQVMLGDPRRDGLDAFDDLFAAGDLRFANLESTITDQNGSTQHPSNTLVFTAPPAAAQALARAGVDLVSLANNHAWDYGEAGLVETFDRLEAASIPWVGAGRTRDAAHAPVVIEKNGQRVAFIAVTDVWNQAYEPHPGKDRIADADAEDLPAAVRAARARPDVDRVVVSYHGGSEYLDQPLPRTREILIGALDAGADAVIGHHPHVVQRVELHDGKPILYSLGNLLMRSAVAHPWTAYGMTARLAFPVGRGPITVAICPHRTLGLDAIPLASDPLRKVTSHHFRTRFERLLRAGARIDPDSAVVMDEFGDDGCAQLHGTTSDSMPDAAEPGLAAVGVR
jgi:poly-gamma-glutamate capsule biosynthesis protein CapA/YwtB (metallophosphatase superfamily)